MSLTEEKTGSWYWLIAGAFFLLFADGRNTIPAASWIALACLLRFSRSQPLWRGMAVLYLVHMVMFAISNRGMIPIPGIFYYLFLVVSGILWILAIILDRVFWPRLRGWYGLFVFPAALVAIQFANGHGLHGSWGCLAYTQAGDLPLLQSLSVFGLWGIVFLIGWFATTANLLLEEGLGSRRALRQTAAFCAVCAVTFLAGGARLAFSAPKGATVRVASLSPLKNGPPLTGELVHAIAEGTASKVQIEEFDSLTDAGLSELLERSDKEAHAGAKIVFWSEEAAAVRKQNEAALLARGSALAVRDHIYLGMSLAVWDGGQAHPLENKIVLLDPEGKIEFEYLKAHPTPGLEMSMQQRSSGRLSLAATSYGRIASAICYDMDFPALMALAGRQNAGIVLSPASDWKAIDPRHTEMAQFRAIEEGFNLVRQANEGFSAAYDYEGHTLAAMDEFHSPDLTMVAEVPMRGVRTVYSMLGDWFAWLCVAALAGMIAASPSERIAAVWRERRRINTTPVVR